jgi:ubiquinone/menaquinone biosynthesis C-methylase UbiE
MLNTLLHLNPSDNVASIGCGGGLWEVMLSFDFENVNFHLQDINPDLLNQNELKQTISYFEKLYSKPNNCNFKIVIGEPKSTNLPHNFFDKVLLINSFHEFEFPELMLVECKNILKPEGQLIIEEQLAEYTGELHEGCGKRLFLEEELIDILNKSGFQKIESLKYENKFLMKSTPSF